MSSAEYIEVCLEYMKGINVQTSQKCIYETVCKGDSRNT